MENPKNYHSKVRLAPGLPSNLTVSMGKLAASLDPLFFSIYKYIVVGSVVLVNLF